jgi:hypothetical protein
MVSRCATAGTPQLRRPGLRVRGGWTSSIPTNGGSFTASWQPDGNLTSHTRQGARDDQVARPGRLRVARQRAPSRR